MLRLFTLTALLGTGAVAVGPDGGVAMTVMVGKTVERDVGNATGWFCDDPSLIDAQLVTRNERNVWIVTGKQAGTTQCRVGTDVSRASFLFDVSVRARR